MTKSKQTKPMAGKTIKKVQDKGKTTAATAKKSSSDISGTKASGTKVGSTTKANSAPKANSAQGAQPSAKKIATKQKTPPALNQTLSVRPQSMEYIMNTTTEQIENATQGAFKQFESLAELNRKSLDAMIKSSAILLKGAEELSKNLASYTQSTVEKSAANSKALLECKTLNELAEAQTTLAQESFEDLISRVTELSELSARITSDAFEPLNDQFNETMKIFGTKLAA